ncbi:hypothetical protein PSAB6_220165 [Paraburkholderia sabiae]|nr:hypothetical protein PSAB6_220165 [Paraburkholderia sabiae]
MCVVLSDTQNVPFGLNATPQPFCRFGSVCAAGVLPSDTSAVETKGLAGGGGALSLPPPQAARPPATAPASAIAISDLYVFIISFLIRCHAFQ